MFEINYSFTQPYYNTFIVNLQPTYDLAERFIKAKAEWQG